jgi:type II secretory pathway predicted ATPase ExeA
MSDSFFGFKKRPFLSTPSLDRYFPAEGIEQAYQTISRVIERAEGPAAIIGGTGLGKSLLCLRIAEAWQSSFDIILLSSSKICTRQALLQNLLFELRMPYRDLSEGELRLSLMERLQQTDEGASRGLILIVDEAQTLTVKLLEELRLLTNLATAGEPRVRLILSGTLRLDELLSHPRLESLQQRLAARCYLKPLLAQEVSRYIRHKVELCGSEIGSVFTEDAIRSIYRASDGIPRLIDQIADNSLLIAERQSQRPVSAATVELAWSEIQQLPAPWTETSSAQTAASVVEYGSLEDDDSEFETEDFSASKPTHTNFFNSEFDLDESSETGSSSSNTASAFGDAFPVVSQKSPAPALANSASTNNSTTPSGNAKRPEVSTRLTAALQAVQIKLNTGAKAKIVPLTPISQQNSTAATQSTTNSEQTAASRDDLFGGGFDEEFIVGLQSTFSPVTKLTEQTKLDRGVTEQQFGFEIENTRAGSKLSGTKPTATDRGLTDDHHLPHSILSQSTDHIEDDIRESISGFTIDSLTFEEPVPQIIPPSKGPKLRGQLGRNPSAYMVRQGMGPNRSHVLSFASLSEDRIEAAGDDRDLLIVEEDVPSRQPQQPSEQPRTGVSPQSYIQLFSRLRG